MYVSVKKILPETSKATLGFYDAEGFWGKVREAFGSPNEKKEHICNMCGDKFDMWDEQEMFAIEKDRLGYGTVYDGSRLNLKLCCRCMEHLIKDCRVNPIEER